MSLIIDPNLPEEELREAVSNWCRKQTCKDCMFVGDESWCDDNSVMTMPIQMVREVVKEINNPNEDNSDVNNEVTNEVTEPVYDIVSHPKHYCREDAMECIEEMEVIFGELETSIFCKLNAWKYRYRAADKNGVEDLKKSDWYIRKYKELRERESRKLPF